MAAVAAIAGLAPAGASVRVPEVRIAAGLQVTSRPTSLVPEDLTDFVFLPSGDLLVAGKNGEVKRVTRTGRAYYLAVLKVDAANNRGLLSIALAPDYRTTGHLYTLATFLQSDGHIVGRVQRWTVDRPAAPTFMTDPVTVLDDIPADGTGDHTIDQVLVAPDGTLFVSSGDGSSEMPGVPTGAETRSNPGLRAFQSQDPTTPLGKILHVTPDGQGVATNPFFDPANPDSWSSRIFALGLRNPFRFTLHGSDVLFVGDVGDHAREMIAVVHAGDNWGWPCLEGGELPTVYDSDPQCATVRAPRAPLYEYKHGNQPKGELSSAAVVGGVFVASSGYRAELGGNYVFGDFVRGDILALSVDRDDHLTRGDRIRELAHGAWMPVAFGLDPAGHVCFADSLHSKVRCLTPT